MTWIVIQGQKLLASLAETNDEVIHARIEY